MGPKAKHTGQSSHTCRMAAANGLRACRTHLGTTLSCSHDCDFQHLWRCQGESRRLKRRHLLHASTRARTATDRSIHCLLGSKAYSESSCEVIQLMVSMREDATSTCIKQVHTSPACRCHSASIAQFIARLPIASSCCRQRGQNGELVLLDSPPASFHQAVFANSYSSKPRCSLQAGRSTGWHLEDSRRCFSRRWQSSALPWEFGASEVDAAPLKAQWSTALC